MTCCRTEAGRSTLERRHLAAGWFRPPRLQETEPQRIAYPHRSLLQLKERPAPVSARDPELCQEYRQGPVPG